jgi:mRNA interferase MazF
MVTRGELWWVDFGDPVGSAPGYQRPAVIVSSDRFNNSRINTATIVPVYSNLSYAQHAGNVFLPAAITGLDRDSIANVTQIGTLDRQQILRYAGLLPPSLMAQLDTGLRLALGL